MNTGIYEKLIDDNERKEALNPHKSMTEQKAKGPLLARIDEI